MKQFEMKTAEEIAATVTLSEKTMKGKFGNCTTKVRKAFIEQHPEYSDCPDSWTWTKNKDGELVFVMSFWYDSNVVIEEKK